jgi:hypothetical protein
MSEEEKAKLVTNYFLDKEKESSKNQTKEDNVETSKKDNSQKEEQTDSSTYLRANGESLDDPLAIRSCKNEQNRDIIENGRLGSYDGYGNYIFIPEIRQELVEIPKLVYNTSVVEDKTTYDLRAKIPIFGDLYFKLKINKYEAKLVLIENVSREAGQYVEVYEELVDSIALSPKTPVSLERIFSYFHIFIDYDDYGMKYEEYCGFENILLKKVYMGLLAKEVKPLVAVDEHECYLQMMEILEESGKYGEKIKKEFITRLRDRKQVFDIKEEFSYDRAINEVLLSSIDMATTKEDKENPKTSAIYNKLINVRNKNLAKYIKQAEKKVDEKYVENVKDRAVKSFIQKNYDKSKDIKLEYVSKLSFTNRKERKEELEKIKKEKHNIEKPLMKQLTKAKQEQEQVAQQEQVEKQQETEEKPLTKEEKIAQIIEKKEKQKEEPAKEPAKEPQKDTKSGTKEPSKSGNSKSGGKSEKVKPSTAQKDKTNAKKQPGGSSKDKGGSGKSNDKGKGGGGSPNKGKSGSPSNKGKSGGSSNKGGRGGSGGGSPNKEKNKDKKGKDKNNTKQGFISDPKIQLGLLKKEQEQQQKQREKIAQNVKQAQGQGKNDNTRAPISSIINAGKQEVKINNGKVTKQEEPKEQLSRIGKGKVEDQSKERDQANKDKETKGQGKTNQANNGQGKTDQEIKDQTQVGNKETETPQPTQAPKQGPEAEISINSFEDEVEETVFANSTTKNQEINAGLGENKNPKGKNGGNSNTVEEEQKKESRLIIEHLTENINDQGDGSKPVVQEKVFAEEEKDNSGVEEKQSSRATDPGHVNINQNPSSKNDEDKGKEPEDEFGLR